MDLEHELDYCKRTLIYGVDCLLYMHFAFNDPYHASL